MTTTADEHLEQARSDVQSAISNLSKIVVDQCDGHDEYRVDFKDQQVQAFYTLIEVRNKLTP